MAGAGFAAGFFGEATNIMRERDKRTREDELIAKELQQKDADWARSTKHDVDMATLNYTLTTSAARNKKVEEVTAARNLYVQAGGDPTGLDNLILTDSENALVQINMLMGERNKFKNAADFRTFTQQASIEIATPESIDVYNKEVSQGGFNAFSALDAMPSQPMSKDVRETIGAELTQNAVDAALRRKTLMEKVGIEAGTDEELRSLTIAINATKDFDTNTQLLNTVGVKAVYDTLIATADQGYNILSHPDLKGNPALLEKVNSIASIRNFDGADIESPYEAAAIIANDKLQGLIPSEDVYNNVLDKFVKTFTIDFLTDEQQIDYITFKSTQPQK
jgi:hypothetical protein